MFRNSGDTNPGYFIELTLRGERVAAIRTTAGRDEGTAARHERGVSPRPVNAAEGQKRDSLIN
jgi:hypothetical protein